MKDGVDISSWRYRAVPVGLFLLSVALFLTPKTPNGGWMGQYVAPNFPPLFTGLPVFRPWIPVESAEYQILGSNWLSTRVAYTVCAFLVLMLLYRESLRLKSTVVFAISLPIVLITMTFAAWGGPFYDITFTLSLLSAFVVLSRLDRNSSKWLPPAVFGLCLVVIDLSRPTGLVVAGTLLLAALYWLRHWRWLIIVISLAFTLPFHVHQYLQFGTGLLSTFSGSNLREVFPYGPDCVNHGAGFGAAYGGIDTRAYAECAAQTQERILANLRTEPAKVLVALKPEHVRQILLPEPYWHGTGLKPDPLSTIWVPVYKATLVVLYAGALISIRVDPRTLAALFVLCYGTLSTLVAHSGYESIRVMLPFIILASWMCLSLPLRFSGNVPASTAK